MTSNIDRFKKDLDRLISTGDMLHMAIQYECHPDEFREMLKRSLKTKEKSEQYLKALPDFKKDYQRWYSEALVLLRQLLPDRVVDFIRHYEKPKSRKDITHENYSIEDYMRGLHLTRGWEKIKVVGPESAIPQFAQQVAIVKAAEARFESSIFEIRQLVQADIFDSELEAAEGLSKYNFHRAAGALAGVVLEGHLSQVCKDRGFTLAKKNPTIADFNELLKVKEVIDVSQWRYIQHLTDIRNLCDHSRKPDPTGEQVKDLIDGVKKIIKTVF